jgi:tetratricopeptide (TPR) repeat protein
MRDGTLTQLEGRGTLLNEATAELLTQLGVQLTESGLQTLLAGNTSTVLAEAGLARGITAQAGGSEIEALFNYTQAITFDPSQIETLSRLNTLSSTISGGTISQRIVNDIQERDRWLEAFKETARFFNDHPPFEIIFDPNLIQIGQTDYARRTANIGMRIALDPSEAGFGALNALLEGLEKTGRRRDWGFSGWPLMNITPRTTGTVVFGGRRSFSYKVDVALVNGANKTIGKGSVTLATERIGFSAGDVKITPPGIIRDVVNFRNIKVGDLSPILTIVIVAVNGISSQNINATGYMKIGTGDLERRIQEQQQREREQQAIAAQEREATPAQNHYNRGKTFYNNGNYDSAIAELNNAIRLNENYAEAYHLRGIVYSFWRINTNLAIQDLTQAIRIDPNNASYYNTRGATYSNRANFDANADTVADLNRAIDDYTQAIRINPNNADFYSNRGSCYSNLGSYNQAILDLETALRINPNNDLARRRLDTARQRASGR